MNAPKALPTSTVAAGNGSSSVISEITPPIQFVEVSFDPHTGQKRKDRHPLQFSKRAKKIPRPSMENKKVVTKNEPCLRCKVLKKQCEVDAGYEKSIYRKWPAMKAPCKNCPRLDEKAEGDHWKVLGCLPGSLSGLVIVFAETLIPFEKFVKRTNRQLVDGSTPPYFLPDVEMFERNRVEHEILGTTHSRNELADFVNTIKIEVDESEIPDLLWRRFHYYTLSQMENFLRHGGSSSVDTQSVLKLWGAFQISKVAGSNLSLPYLSSFILGDHKPITGHRFGGEILSLAGLLLSCQKGHSCRAGQLAPCPDYLPYQDHVYSMFPRFYLNLILNQLFAKLGSRHVLQEGSWLQVFSDLCGLATVKSVLTDLQTKRLLDLATPDLQNATLTAIRINSLYGIIVSLFSWASKYDPLHLEEIHSVSNWNQTDARVLKIIKKTVQHDKWKERGIKSSKEFLLGLGSGFYDDGNYKGFYIQQFGLEANKQALKKKMKARGILESKTSTIYKTSVNPLDWERLGHENVSYRIQTIASQIQEERDSRILMNANLPDFASYSYHSTIFTDESRSHVEQQGSTSSPSSQTASTAGATMTFPNLSSSISHPEQNSVGHQQDGASSPVRNLSEREFDMVEQQYPSGDSNDFLTYGTWRHF